MATNNNYHCNQISSLNPFCCFRPPINKDNTAMRRCITEDITSAASSAHPSSRLRETSEPVSPIIGCTGQIKRDKIPPRKGPQAANKWIRLWRRRKACPKASAKVGIGDVYFVEMDTPLPVLKRSVGSSGRLWEKRCGAKGLQGLQLQQQRLQQVQHLCVYAGAF